MGELGTAGCHLPGRFVLSFASRPGSDYYRNVRHEASAPAAIHQPPVEQVFLLARLPLIHHPPGRSPGSPCVAADTDRVLPEFSVRASVAGEYRNRRAASRRKWSLHQVKQVILYLTHLLPDDILHEFQRLAASVQPVAPVRLLFHQTREQTPAQLRSQPVYRFTDDDITALACPMLGERFVPGSIHLPVLKFFQDHGDYDYYWYVENDVRFTGDWRAFFEPFSAVPGDLLTSHIRRYQEEPWWDRWRLTHPREEIPRRRRLRSFNPICRFSRRALEVLWEAQRDGWCGHQEVLLPTLLHERGCQLVEISGQGAFVPPGFADRF